MDFVFALGEWVEDRVTGFKGIAIGRSQYLTGCNLILVQPRVDEKGAHVESRWIDEPRLSGLRAPAVKLTDEPDSLRQTGADKEAPRR